MQESSDLSKSSHTDSPGESQGQPDPYRLFKGGCAFLASGHPGAAALLLERAKRLEPGKNSILEALGRAYFALRQYERARHEFETIISVVPVNDYAHYALGRTLLELGCRDEAQTHLRLALALHPGQEHYRRALAALDRDEI
jgi:tetratricopeptide (TPR) repeat protein